MMFCVVFSKNFSSLLCVFQFLLAFYFWIGLQCCQTHHDDGKRDGRTLWAFDWQIYDSFSCYFLSVPKLFWDGCLLARLASHWAGVAILKLPSLKIFFNSMHRNWKPSEAESTMKKSRWNDQQVKSWNWLCFWQPRECFVQLDLLWF